VGRVASLLVAVATAGPVVMAGCVPRAERADAMVASDTPSGGAGEPAPAATTLEGAQLPGTRLVQIGLATWYGASLAGHRTASGERFDPQGMTAAHRTLPLGTWVEVRRTDGQGPAVRVRINDRGPAVSGVRGSHRIIDLSRRAAQELGIVRLGTAEVSVRVVAGP
jgi:rare lipoprotein A